MKLTPLLAFTACLTLLAVIALPGHAQGRAPTGQAVVVTRTGSVAGTAGDIETFKGIPYAAPPVGSLRWRAPQPPTPWKGVRDAMLPIRDGLPKFKDFPAGFGGSDQIIPE